jgi:hypothetical protein
LAPKAKKDDRDKYENGGELHSGKKQVMLKIRHFGGILYNAFAAKTNAIKLVFVLFYNFYVKLEHL